VADRGDNKDADGTEPQAREGENGVTARAKG